MHQAVVMLAQKKLGVAVIVPTLVGLEINAERMFYMCI